MGLTVLCAALAFLNIIIVYFDLIFVKHIREFQQWRQDVTEICMQQIRSDDHA